jgi:acyl carrier protein
MDANEIRPRLNSIFAEILGAAPERISDATIIDDLAADSLEFTQAVMEVEAVFDIEISDKHIDALMTVGDLVALIEATSRDERPGSS